MYKRIQQFMLLHVLVALLAAQVAALVSFQPARTVLARPAAKPVEQVVSVSAVKSPEPVRVAPKATVEQVKKKLKGRTKDFRPNVDAMALAYKLNAKVFGEEYWLDLLELWKRESLWDDKAVNPTSGACGIPQALHCSKIKDLSWQGQVRWGINYIKDRYGNPRKALKFWMSKSSPCVWDPRQRCGGWY